MLRKPVFVRWSVTWGICLGLWGSWSLPCSGNAAVNQSPVDGSPLPVTPLVWHLSSPATPEESASADSRPASPPDQAIRSPTVRFSGETVLSLIHPIGESLKTDQGSAQTNLGYRLRLNVEASFNGDDRLRLRLQSVDVARLDRFFGTDLARLAIQGDKAGQVDLSRLDYRFAVGDRTEVSVYALGGSISDVANSLNPLFDSSGDGALSRFGQRNPIFRQGGGAGIGFSHEVSDAVQISLGYLANAESVLPTEDSEAVAFAQLTHSPAKSWRWGLLYAYGLNAIDTGTGTQLANDPFEGESDAITSHALGLQATGRLTSDLQVSGWLGWTRAIATDLPNTPNTDIWNWAITAGYQDLGRKGNLGGIIIGRPPQPSTPDRNSVSRHFELFYKFQANAYLAVTPGIILILDPEAEENRSIWVGNIRTTFRF